MVDYAGLLSRYGCGKAPGERWSRDSEAEAKRNQRLMDYLRFAEYAGGELRLTKNDLEHLFHIIRCVDLNDLYRKGSYESIIVCLGFCLKRRGSPGRIPDDYRICKKYDVDWALVGKVMNNYSHILESRMPLPYNKC